MIRRFLRYASLILCLLLLGAWGVSTWNVFYCSHWESETGKGRTMAVVCGTVHVESWTVSGVSDKKDGFDWGHAYPASETPMIDRLGLVLPRVDESQIVISLMTIDRSELLIPLWVMLAPLSAVTAWLWWPWLRERRKKASVGFEVEAKPVDAKPE